MVNVIIQYTDIWSFDMMTWHFVAANTLVSGRNPENNKHHDRQFIAELGAVQPCRAHHHLGLCTGAERVQYSGTKVPPNIQGEDKDKWGFLHFLSRILCWRPEERPSVKDLIFDPWLIDGLGFTDEQAGCLSRTSAPHIYASAADMLIQPLRVPTI
ncbi:hypothetical protein I7I51_08753 [Histoplasma capsulatum]|uniref:Protein kinase domain-containing protein n=1 Tax=Ajellomyces capsulatus TaxID=5037 RepID=A0A8A1LZM8_AJECA|nr:hypothetical protein I7I51_08753 [Histoplasma capsulatum]